MDNIITFGKYKGQKIKVILLHNPQYINWCLFHIDGFSLNKQESELFDQVTNPMCIDYHDNHYYIGKVNGCYKKAFKK